MKWMLLLLLAVIAIGTLMGTSAPPVLWDESLVTSQPRSDVCAIKQYPSLERATQHEVLRVLTCQRHALLGWSCLQPKAVQRAH